MYTAFKYKLKPTKEQEQRLSNWMGASRWIWNWCLELNQKEYANTKKFIFRNELKCQLPKLKEEHEWLKDVPSQALQNRVIDFDQALKRVWKSKFGFPKFKSKKIEHHNTLRISQINNHIKISRKQIQIPKMGWCDWRYHRPIKGTLKSITIKRENGVWWCVCLCELPDPVICTNAIDADVVGIDLGLKDFAVTSDGEVFGTPKIYRKKQKKLRRLQRILARRRIGSKNRERARKRLNRLHYKIKNQRQDFTHKISSQITNDYLFIALEDLNIKGMMKNRRLSKAIADQGWRQFVNQLEYKSKAKGGCMVRIGRWLPSSKTCSSCGNHQDMPLSVRIYSCSGCGMKMSRDVNAALNIKQWGIDTINRCGTHRIYACGDTNDGGNEQSSPSYVSGKQEKFMDKDEVISIHEAVAL